MLSALWLAPQRNYISAHLAAPDFTTGALNTAREGHTATLLQNGKVLVAGGRNGTLVFNTAELYDPSTGTWTAAPGFGTARFGHSAVLLRSGLVLILGGQNANGAALDSAEVYDPAANAWQPALSSKLTAPRFHCTATLLNTGQVLVAGGLSGGAYLRSAELYDPAKRTWTLLNNFLGSLFDARAEHTATLLGDGRVLIAGGINASGNVKTAELFEPTTNRWRRTNDPLSPRRQHTATRMTDGTVVFAGGVNGQTVLASAEIYDPAKGNWAQTDALTTGRRAHTATLLPNGRIIVTGGVDAGNKAVSASETYDASKRQWLPAEQAPPFNDVLHFLQQARSEHTATLLPNSQLLLAGGLGDNNAVLKNTELYEYATGTWAVTRNTTTGTATQMNNERSQHTATLLPGGRVLVAGGLGGSAAVQLVLSSAELFDPNTGAWTQTGALNTARFNHTATLLPNGRVLVVGGQTLSQTILDAPELFDPTTGAWTKLNTSGVARYAHTATLLPNGTVLIAGGLGVNGQPLRSAQIFDPNASPSDAWRNAQDLPLERFNHTATLLPDGTVFLFGGKNTEKTSLNNAALFNANSAWTTRNFPNFPPFFRAQHTATLLPNNRVLIAGGLGGTISDVSGLLPQADIYNHTTGLFETARPTTGSRYEHTATLLPNGKVLLAGGRSIGTPGSTACPNQGATPQALLFDPTMPVSTATAVVSITNPLQMRNGHTATLLVTGEVLWAGGLSEEVRPACAGTPLKQTELFNTGLNFREEWQPAVAFVVGGPNTNTAVGVHFQGITDASDGASAAGNYPVAQLFSLSNEQILFVPANSGWTNNTYGYNPVVGFAPGLALLTLYTNGIPSRARVVTSNGGGLNVPNAQPFGSISGRVIFHNTVGVPITLTFAPTPNSPAGCNAARTLNNSPNGEFSFRDLIVTPDGGRSFCRYQITPTAANLQFFPTSGIFTMIGNATVADPADELAAATASVPDQGGLTCQNCINNVFVARGPFWQLGGNVQRSNGTGVSDTSLEFSVPYEIFDDRLTCKDNGMSTGNDVPCTPGVARTVNGDVCAKVSSNPLITDATFKCACTTLRSDGVCEKTVLARFTPASGAGSYTITNVPNGADAIITPFNLPAGTQYSYSAQPLAPPGAATENFVRVDQTAQNFDNLLITANTSGCAYALSTTGMAAPVGGGASSVNLTAGNTCAWSASSNSAWLTINAGAGGTGNGTINFSVAANTNPASRAGTLTIAGITFTVTQPGTGAAAALTNVSAASFFADRQAPDSIVASFGAKLATGSLAATTVPLPDTLLGTIVSVRDSANVTRRAQLFFVSPNQVNFLLPAQTATGTATVTITTGDNVTSAGLLQVERVAPGLFSVTANGVGIPAAVLLRAPASGPQTFEAVARFESNHWVAVPINLGPASDQVFLILFGTGLRLRNNLADVKGAVDGLSTPISFAQAQGSLIGTDQINLGPLPRALAGRGTVNVTLQVEGRDANSLMLVIQ